LDNAGNIPSRARVLSRLQKHERHYHWSIGWCIRQGHFK
jgi:hypothetical protein